MVKQKKRGRPVTHPKIRNVELDKVYKTYTDAALDISCDRTNVYRNVIGLQTHCKGYHFEYIQE